MPYLHQAAVGCSLPAIPAGPGGIGQWLAQGGFLCNVNVSPPTSYDGFVATFITGLWNGNFFISHFATVNATDGLIYNFRAARQRVGRPYACGTATPTNTTPNPNHPKGLVRAVSWPARLENK